MPHDPVPARRRRHAPPALALEALAPDVRAAVEAMVLGHEVTLNRDGRPIGVLAYRPGPLEGSILGSPSAAPDPADSPDHLDDARRASGVTVVATATKLSDAARRRLSDELGPDYVVLDLLEAPSTADVVLTHAVSPQLLGMLRADFPDARVIVTEIEDEELGVNHPGPVSRLLDAGAAAYLPPRPLREVAANVHAYLTGAGAPQLTSGGAGRPAAAAQLPAAPNPPRR